MEDNFIWYQGKIMRQSEALVNVLSPSAQFGLNVFEGIRCYWNKNDKILYAFRLKDHLDRLMQSCVIMGLVSPYNKDEIIERLKNSISANDFRCDIAIRLTILADGTGSWNSSEPLSMFIAPMAKARTDLAQIPALRASVSSWERINDNALPPRAKVGANYINGRYAHLQAERDGYDVPIFLGADRKVSEGAGACLFMVRDGCLITPTITSSLLEGITRDTVIKLASEMGINVIERTIDRTELYLSEEIFFCGSAAEITPIVSVDKFQIGSGVTGPLTLKLLQKYLTIVSGTDIDYPEWRTCVYQIERSAP